MLIHAKREDENKVSLKQKKKLAVNFMDINKVTRPDPEMFINTSNRCILHHLSSAGLSYLLEEARLKSTLSAAAEVESILLYRV